jgi:protein tyrosine/serine phosphatase
MEDFDITPVVIKNANADVGEVAEESVLQALEVLLDASNYPVLVTCKYGRTLNGAVIGCLRKLQRWSFISIFDEYRRFARTQQEQQHEQFIEYVAYILIIN